MPVVVLSCWLLAACSSGSEDTPQATAPPRDEALRAEVAAMEARLHDLENETRRLRQRTSRAEPASPPAASQSPNAPSSEDAARALLEQPLPRAGPIKGRAQLARARYRRLAALRVERQRRLAEVSARYQTDPQDPQLAADMAAIEVWFRGERARILAPQGAARATVP